MGLLKSAFILGFQKSPILLVDGFASKIPGGILPIAVFTEGLSIINGLVGGDGFSLDLLSANFKPAPGTTLINQEISSYPFLNQSTAANAVIQKPNRITMHMTRPVTTKNGGMVGKLPLFMALKLALEEHNSSGGTYTVMTPSYVYTGCLLRSVVDITGFNDEVKQVQYEWAFEFEQPLLMVSELDTALSDLMSKFTKGTP
ncbi:hypothetical protein, partial [Budvicia aquatica]|uniref:Uncharacterized protein n=1 Tax=Budvicia aquatica TaxID=82979 RepID=A0A2C6DLF8_9GAMM